MTGDDHEPFGDESPDEWLARLLSSESIEGQPIREPSALERQQNAERAERARRLHERLSAEQPHDGYRIDNDGRAYWPPDDAPPARSTRRRPYLGVIAIVTVMAMLLGYLSIRQRTDTDVADSFTPFAERPMSGDSIDTGSFDGPTPQRSESSSRLQPNPSRPRYDQSFRFIRTQRGTTQPIAYDPCRPIRYVINPNGAPEGAEEITRSAFERLGEVTGLFFESLGTITEAPTSDRTPYSPELYGDTWAPVVIWWTSPEVVAELEGDVAGVGGSVWTWADPNDDDSAVMVSGSVALDAGQIAEISKQQPNGQAQARSVVLHELAHVVGLDHVDDPTQLMNPVGSPLIVDFNSGDLNGLWEVGNGRCFEEF